MNFLCSIRFSLFLLLQVGLILVLTIPEASIERLERMIDQNPRLGLPCPAELNYSPLCICDYWPYTTYNIFCNITSTADWSLLTETFRNTTIIEHFELQLTLAQSEMSIPANVLSDKIAQSIIIKCADESIQLSSIHPNAFAGTKTNSIMIELCSMANFNFAFLAQINASLEVLHLYNTTLERFELMPQLPQLKMLELYGVRGLKALWSDAGDSEQFTTPLLETVIINSVVGGLNEADMNGISELLQLYESSLRYLHLVGLGLSQVPPVARELAHLRTLDLSDNLITELSDGSMALQSTLDRLLLLNVPLRAIHPNAFQGNFRATSINLIYNQLTTISYDVFYDLLQQMLYSSGSIYLYGNPLLCDDCQMAWLLHDNRNLLPKMQGTTCGNNMTILEDLDPVFFSRCNEEPNSSANSIIFANKIVMLIPVGAAIFFIVSASNNKF